MNRLLSASAAAMLAAALLVPAAGAAEPRPMDTIRLSLSVEGWVQTETARVVAAVHASVREAEMADARNRIMEAFDALAPDLDAEWRVIGFHRFQDASGLEQWRMEAEARLPEAALGGLYERAQEASRPGQRLEIADIDFTPTLAEREAARASLRTELYAAAAAERDRLAEAFPDGQFRVHRIDLLGDAGPMPQMQRAAAPMAATRMYSEAADAGGAGQVAVAQRLVLSATVIIGTDAPAIDASGNETP